MTKKVILLNGIWNKPNSEIIKLSSYMIKFFQYKICLLVCLILLSSQVSSKDQQTILEYDSLISYVHNNIYSSPDQTISMIRNGYETISKSGKVDEVANYVFVLGVAYSESHKYDSALFVMDHFLQEHENSLSKKMNANFYNLLGSIFSDMGSYEVSLDYYLKALDDAKYIKYAGMVGLLHMNIGNIMMQFGEVSKAMGHYEKSLKVATETHDSLSLNRINNAIGVMYISENSLDLAEVFLLDALKIAKQNGFKHAELNSLKQFGILALERNELKLAEGYFANILNNKSATLGQKTMALNAIGDIEKQRENFDAAIAYYKKALDLAQKISSLNFQSDLLNKLHIVYSKKKEFETALDYLQSHHQIYDSIYNINTAFKVKTKEYQYALKHRKELREKSDILNRLIIIFSLIALISLAYIFYIRDRKQKLIIENNRLNLDLSEKRKTSLKKDVELKNAELIQKSLQVYSENELKSDMLLKLKSIDKLDAEEVKSEIRSIVSDLKMASSSNFWDEFEMYFTRVHPDFYQNLYNDFPKLSSNDKRICGFIKLNMSTKDVSLVTKQSVNAIKIARGRLRKKLGLIGKKQSLSEFLDQY